jgi:hypothetical protein
LHRNQKYPREARKSSGDAMAIYWRSNVFPNRPRVSTDTSISRAPARDVKIKIINISGAINIRVQNAFTRSVADTKQTCRAEPGCCAARNNSSPATAILESGPGTSSRSLRHSSAVRARWCSGNSRVAKVKRRSLIRGAQAVSSTRNIAARRLRPIDSQSLNPMRAPR